MTVPVSFLRRRQHLRAVVGADICIQVAEQVANWSRLGVPPAECLRMLRRNSLPCPAWSDVAWALIETTAEMESSMKRSMTSAERNLLKCIQEAGSVAIQKGGTGGGWLLSQGERLPHTLGTALFLLGKGMLFFADANHLEVSATGMEVVAELEGAA